MNKKMKIIALLLLSILPLIISCGGGGGGGGDEQPAPTVNVTGTWSGTLSTSLLPETPVIFNLTQATASGVIVSTTSRGGIAKQEVVRAASANVTGTYNIGDVEGTVSGTVNGNTINFTLTHTTPSCPGTFSGTATVNGDAMTFTLKGSDCLGTHSNGQGTATKATQGGLGISDGKFEGTELNEANVKDEVNVQNNKITSVNVAMPGTCSGIVGAGISPDNGPPIINGQFTEQWHTPATVSYSSYDMTVNGTFSDNDHVSGTWSYSDADNCQMSGSWSATRTGSASDTTPPTVSSTSPANGATDVAINSAITATFSETMDASTISTETFTIGGVAGTVTYSGTTATFTPSTNLAYSTAYTATITIGAKDAAGNNMAANHTWTFTTGVTPDTTPPAVSSTSPANGATDVAINSAITATFSETMDASTINTATFTIGGVTGTVTYGSFFGTTATFTPSTTLAYNTTYKATITTGAKDTAGNNMASNYTWSFTTKSGYVPVTSWGGNGTTNGKFGALGGLDIDSQGNIWAADSQNETIQKFDTSGNYLTKFISNIETGATYSGPTHIAFGNDNYLYAMSTAGFWLARYDTSGNQEYLGNAYGSGSVIDFDVDARNGDIYVVSVGLLAKVRNDSVVWSKELSFPNSVAVDPSGNVYVTAYPGIQKYDPDGNFITECENSDFGGVSRGLLRFDSLNRLYFLSTSSGPYIKVFDTSLNLISRYDIVIETGDYYFNFGSFAVEGDGQYVYIAHTGGNNQNKILKYNRE